MRKKGICSKLRSKEFLNNLGRVKEYTQDIWQKDTMHHPEFTPHGIQHSKNVVENISKVIPVELLNVLSERDIYYLCCACHLHDIGMLFVPDKLLPLPLDTVGKFVVRKIHGTASRYMIHTIPEISSIFNKTDRSIIGKLCELHTGDISEMIESNLKHSSKHFPLLVSILRICDACDVTKKRFPERLFYLMKLESEPESYLQWAPMQYIDEVSLEEREIVVHAIVPAISENSIKFLIEQMVIQKLNEEVSQVNPILEEYDFVYGTVKSEVSSDEYLSPDEKIADLISNSKREEKPLELKILSYLSKTPMREAELAEKIGISTMALRNRVSPLIKRGMVYIREDNKGKIYEFLPVDKRKEFLEDNDEKGWKGYLD